MNTNRQRGHSLNELLVVLAIFGLFISLTSSAVSFARRGASLAGATAELRAILQRARATAVARRANVAIRFAREGNDWTWALYGDGDGDGVRNADIAAGIDRVLERPRTLQLPGVRVGAPAGVPDPFAAGELAARAPVRFGNSMLCSFSREGEATNGSVVLTDGRHVNVIRVSGTSAHITVLRWNGRRWLTSE